MKAARQPATRHTRIAIIAIGLAVVGCVLSPLRGIASASYYAVTVAPEHPYTFFQTGDACTSGPSYCLSGGGGSIVDSVSGATGAVGCDGGAGTQQLIGGVNGPTGAADTNRGQITHADHTLGCGLFAPFDHSGDFANCLWVYPLDGDSSQNITIFATDTNHAGEPYGNSLGVYSHDNWESVQIDWNGHTGSVVGMPATRWIFFCMSYRASDGEAGLWENGVEQTTIHGVTPSYGYSNHFISMYSGDYPVTGRYTGVWYGLMSFAGANAAALAADSGAGYRRLYEGGATPIAGGSPVPVSVCTTSGPISGQCKWGITDPLIPPDCSGLSLSITDFGQDVNWLGCNLTDLWDNIANIFIGLWNYLDDLIVPNEDIFGPINSAMSVMVTKAPFGYSTLGANSVLNALGAPPGSASFTLHLGPIDQTVNFNGSSFAVLDFMRTWIAFALYATTGWFLFHSVREEFAS
jgi:hypothetical protein